MVRGYSVAVLLLLTLNGCGLVFQGFNQHLNLTTNPLR